MRTLLLLLTGAMLAAGCGASGGGQVGAGSTSGPATTTTTIASERHPTPTSLTPGQPTVSTPSPPGTPGADVPAKLLDQIRADAAQRAGVTPGQVQIAGSAAHTWNDGSLGCPKPGESYIQVMVDGFQVFVLAGGHTFDYRTSQSVIKLCEQ